MSVEIPNAAAVNCSVDLTNQQGLFSGGGSTADAILSAIAQELLFDGLTISQKNVGLSGITYPITGEFSAQIQILNQSGQELDDTDLTQQFFDACATLSIQVNSFAVLEVIGADSGVNSGTGTQGNARTGAGVAASPSGGGGGVPACGDPNLSFWKYPEQWISCITSKGLSTIGLLAIGLLVGIILIVGIERRPSAV